MYITRKELLEMKINNQNKKMYMLLLFAMIVMLLVFKIIYIRREYVDLNTDYSVYVVMFMPFVIFYALKYMDNITSAAALNWLCTVPMSIYLYQSMYLRFKQFDMLIAYSLMGIFINLIVFKKAELKEFILAVSGYIMLNILTLAGAVRELVNAVTGKNYEQCLVMNIIKNAKCFKASADSQQYLDALFYLPGKSSRQYFIAEKITQYGLLNVIFVFILIVGVMAILLYKNYKRNKEVSLIATAIMIIQSVCFLFVNLGILRGSVYEIPFFKENTVYSVCQLLLLGVALDIKGSFLNIAKKRI